MSIVIAIIIFSIIILFHELGHFLLAKANGVQVNEFCLGLGPTIVGFTRGETKYSLKLLPFGGACMMEGEDDDSTNDRAFNKKGVWQRFSIVAAGPVFNFIMAWVFSVILLGCAGYDLPNLYQVSDGSPAAEAGLQAGDTIVKLNHKNIHFFREISVFTYFHEGETVDVTYVRDGEKHTVSITPEYSKDTKSYLFGFVGSGVNTRGNVLQVLKYSFLEVHYWICTMLESLKMMFTGHVSLNDVSGPVGIVKTIGDTYTESMLDGIYYAVMNLLNITILLSANLGVMNLLPLPALDGGRLLFFIIEAIRRKKIDPNKEGMVHFVGLIILLALMVLIMFNDIRKLIP